MSELRLQIDGTQGEVAADSLVSALKRTLALLAELDRTSGREGPRGRWLVGEVWNGSVGVALASPIDVTPELPERLVEGLRLLDERPELPPWFSVKAVEQVEKMGKAMFRDHGVSSLRLTSVPLEGERTSAQVTPLTVEHAAAAFQGTDEALGSVVGVLDVVNLRRRPMVSLYDAEERHAVRCSVPEDLLERVRADLGMKVRASGIVTRNLVGQVALVKVESLDRIDEQPRVPSVAELTGIAPWYTAGRTAVEQQRWIRGA